MRTNHQQRVMLSRKSKDLQQLCEDYAANPELRKDLLEKGNNLDFRNLKRSEICSVVAVCLAGVFVGFIAGAVAVVGAVAGAWTVAMCNHIGLPCNDQHLAMQAMTDVVTYRNLV